MHAHFVLAAVTPAPGTARAPVVTCCRSLSLRWRRSAPEVRVWLDDAAQAAIPG